MEVVYNLESIEYYRKCLYCRYLVSNSCISKINIYLIDKFMELFSISAFAGIIEEKIDGTKNILIQERWK